MEAVIAATEMCLMVETFFSVSQLSVGNIVIIKALSVESESSFPFRAFSMIEN